MQSRAKTVTEYMKDVPAAHLDALTEFREICLRNLPGFRESMEYGLPSYLLNNEIEVAWESGKNEVILHIKNEDVVKNFKPQLKSLDTGKNHIHFRKLDQIDFAMVTALVQKVAKIKNAVLV